MSSSEGPATPRWEMSTAAASTILVRVRSPWAVSLGRARASLPTASRYHLLGLTTHSELTRVGPVTHSRGGKRLIMILVTTPAKVGSDTARLLRERDVPVRLLARHPPKATPSPPPDAA